MKIGFVGWRGMVGSVLMQRMQEEGDFGGGHDYTFFSTSSAGGEGPSFMKGKRLENALDIVKLKECGIIVTCQGSDWTNEVYPKLQKDGWKGIFIDAASALRMKDESIIILDPLNHEAIVKGLKGGIRTFVGGNCTVSLMLMAMHGLFKRDLVEWVNSSTYQAASGAGAKNMIELIKQMGYVSKDVQFDAISALELERKVMERSMASDYPKDNFLVPLACSLIPWIDKLVEGGQTKEEWKGHVEANKILGTTDKVTVDGLCVRISSMRCHSQSLLMKLKKDLPLKEIEETIASANEWAYVVPNEEMETKKRLTPMAVSGTLKIGVGRLHKSRLGGEYLQAFTVGDQLLWGAAEPIRRMMNIALKNM